MIIIDVNSCGYNVPREYSWRISFKRSGHAVSANRRTVVAPVATVAVTVRGSGVVVDVALGRLGTPALATCATARGAVVPVAVRVGFS